MERLGKKSALAKIKLDRGQRMVHAPQFDIM